MTSPHEDKKSTLENAITRALQPYGQNYLLIAPGADRFSEPAPFMAPYPTLVQISTDPDKGQVFKVGTKNLNGQWTDVFALSAPALRIISHAAGIIWHPRLCRAIVDERERIVYEAVGCIRLPDGSMQVVKGTREIDLRDLEEEAVILQARKWVQNQKLGALNKKWSDMKPAEQYAFTEEIKKEADFDTLPAEAQAQVRRLVKMEMIEFKKHRHARAETGAKKRAVFDLGIPTAYTAADLARPLLFVRWGLSPTSDRSQWEMRALWGESSGPAPKSPLQSEEEMEGEWAEYEAGVDGATGEEAVAGEPPPAEEGDPGALAFEDERRAHQEADIDLLNKSDLLGGIVRMEKEQVSEQGTALEQVRQAHGCGAGLLSSTLPQLKTYYKWLAMDAGQ